LVPEGGASVGGGKSDAPLSYPAPVRILFLNDLSDPRIGSSIRQMYEHGAVLRRQGHETALATAVQAAAEVGETEIEGMRVFRLLSDYPPRYRAWVSLNNPRVRAPFAALLKTYQPDIVHSHLLHSHLSYHSLTQARAAGAGVVFTAHDVMTFCYQKLTCFHGGEAQGGTLRDYPAHWSKCIPCQRLRYRPGRNSLIKRVLARDVHRFTVVSDELGRAIGANGIQVHRRIWNAIEPKRSLPTQDAVAAFKASRGIAQAQLIAIGGRLHEQKGVAQLLKMLARLAPQFPDLKLLVMGKREVYDREFAALAQSLGVAERVVPTGWLDGEELQCAYAAVDVFVTPSICFDTFGLVNLEAMQHGKPVVATTFGGSQEVVQHGQTGYIENPFDVGAYAARIAELLRDPALARRLGEAGRQRLHAHFGMERLVSEFNEEYALALRLARANPVG
jgi:glycosyltransferase involved in cell wall biosynthesis